MNKSDVAKLVFMLKEFYPNSQENSSIENRVNAWFLILQGYNYKEAEAAILAFAATDTKGFMPSVGQIVDKITKQKSGSEMTEMEAWGYVQKATGNSLYNSVEEYEKLPPAIKCLVGSHNQLREWALMNNSEFNTVVQSNFMRSFRASQAEKREQLAIPEKVKNIAITDGEKR